MKINELVRSLNVWCNNEELAILESFTEPRLINSFEERDQHIIENLIRKSLVIKVQGKNSTYVYPNI
jgi:hypothetical protein